MAALAGLTFAAPTVTFCAPGDRLAARRLHLPQAPGVRAEDQLIWHFGHTADPIYMGSCTVLSPNLVILNLFHTPLFIQFIMWLMFRDR